MSLEYIFEKYPASVTMKNGAQYTIRPAQDEDARSLYRFWSAIPEEERMFVKQRLSDREAFESWFLNRDDEVTPMLVLEKEGEISAFGRLRQREGGWKRHIGEVNVLVHPETRGLGMSSSIINDLVEIARHCGLTKLEAEFNGERKIAIRSFAAMGFRELTRVPEYLQDLSAAYHDYVLMSMDITTDEEFASAY